MNKHAFLFFFFGPDSSGALHLSILCWISITVSKATHATPGK